MIQRRKSDSGIRIPDTKAEHIRLKKGRSFAISLGMAGQIVQFRISVKRTLPQVWRVLQLMENSSLRTLRLSICGVLGWIYSDDSKFLIGEELYGDPEFDAASDGWLDDSKVKLGNIIKKNPHFEFVCGFDSNWVCLVELEDLSNAKINYRYPYCTAGENLAPPEDCEDVASFELYKYIVSDPKSGEHRSLKQMHSIFYGKKPFNPLGFNREYANRGRLHSRRWSRTQKGPDPI